MALFFHNQKLTNLSHADKPFDTLEHTGHVIYRNKLATGTIVSTVGSKAFIGDSMTSGSATNPNVVLDGVLPLSVPLRKIKTGLSFYPPASQKIITYIQPEDSYTRSAELDSLIPAKFDVSLTDLQTGGYVTLWNPQLEQYGDGVLKVKYDATTNSLTFEDDRSTVNHANWSNSTAFASGYEPGAWALLLIEKVTAY